jgi:Metallo-beta-lactamase superfamily
VKLRVFHAADGDCLLLTSGDGHHALIDGGRGGTFEKETWPVLRKFAKDKRPIDLVIVSHIDADHISGILWLMNVVAAWAVHDYQTNEGGNPHFPEPAITRPPEIAGLWHNSWRAQLGDLADPVESYLAGLSLGLESATVERSTLPDAAVEIIEAVEGLAQSIPQGVELLHVIDDATPIPRNAPFDDLVLLKNPPHIEALGTAKLTLIGPARKHLDTLREEWREWIVKTSGAPPEALPAQPAGHGLGFGVGLGEAPALDGLPGDLLVALLVAAAEIIVATDPTKVTPPNRASITVLAEEQDRTCLLTGDAAEEELLEGLEAAGRIVDGRFWCNVVKVQHHGSEHNLSQQFAGTVLADHYVLCGDGAHGNPEPSVIKTIIDTRLAADGRPFTIWFNSSPERTLESRRKTLRAAIKEATAAAAKHPAITVEVLDDAKDSHEIPV